MDIIFKILKETGLEYSAVTNGSDSVIFFALGYSPYKIIDRNILEIDAHYPAYVRLHNIKQQILRDLKAAGINAKSYHDDHYKSLVVKSTLVSEGFNNLMHHSKYGTRLTLQAIKIENSKRKFYPETEKNLRCAGCQKCIQACPTGALEFQATNKHKFTRAKCLRQFQADGNLTSEHYNIIGNKFLGCSICQDICPSNAKIKYIQPDSNYLKLFDKQIFIKNFEGGDVKAYEKYLGNNYIKNSQHWLNIVKQLKLK